MSNGQEGGRDGSFRLPRPTFGLFFPIFFGPIVFGGRRFPPGTGGGLSALPKAAPQPPPFSPPPIFQGPAANDPIFRVARKFRIPRILGRLPGLAGVVFTAAEILVEVVGRKIETDRLGDIAARQSSEIARIQIGAIEDALAAELELRIQKRIEALRNAPETFEIPEVEPTPAPLRRIAPEIFPDVFPASPTPFPAPLPAPVGVPGPVAPTVPRPTPSPAPSPLPGPVRRTFPIGFPVQLPVFFPRFTPVGDPQLLTPFQSTPVPSPGTGPTSQFGFSPDPRLQPQLDPQTDPDRCKRRCDDRENRTQCFKGLFRESTSSIDFTDWQEVDCISGRDIESTGVAGRITSEVVELF